MKEIIWISERFALAVHQRQIAEHGGKNGIRDIALLSSALARPKNIHVYEPEADIAVLAAAYAFGITKNHPFIDGNKRTAFIVMYIFLRDNGHDLTPGNDQEEYLIMIQLAEGSLSEDDLASWIRDRLI